MKDSSNCRTCKHFKTLVEYEPCCNCCNAYEDGELLADLWESPDDAQDSVNHPKHYNSGYIECIDAMQSAFGVLATQDFCLLSAFKYIWRCRLFCYLYAVMR